MIAWRIVLGGLVLVASVSMPAPAWGAVSMEVKIGWDGQYRAGRWAPLFVTLSDSAPRAVVVDVYTPHSNGLGMLTRIGLTVTPTPATYAIYVPLPHSLYEMSITVRDARNERRLLNWPDPDSRGELMPGQTADVLIGMSGRAPTMRAMQGAQTRDGIVQTGFMEPLKLPIHPTGYDALSLLVLNQPDLNRMDPQQHQAIADWVRSGGNLLLWPGTEPVPPASALVAILPCTIGEMVALRTDPKLLDEIGLPPRFAEMHGRELTPEPGAEPIHPLGQTGPLGWRGRVGLGQVIVLPFDPTFFVFRDESAAKVFWEPVLSGVVDLRATNEQHARYYYWNDPALRRRSEAFNHTADLLGNVPGIGQFGFTYVAGVLIALMLIVGPVDWLVLRYLGKQPWTWITTSGWIALVTVGALFVGHLFKSGDLHFRTLRVIDQADGQVIGALDLICIYSPRTRQYQIDVPRESWWQPTGDGRGYGRSFGNDIPFIQDAVSTRPANMLINVWNLRLLEGQSVSTEPPLLDASLRLEQHDGQTQIVGTITNRSKHALRNVRIRTPSPISENEPAMQPLRAWSLTNAPELQRIEPGQTIDLRTPAEAIAAPDELPLVASDLAVNRTAAIDRLLALRDDLMCIYAELEDPQPVTGIAADDARQQHWQVLRAVVPLQGAKQ